MYQFKLANRNSQKIIDKTLENKPKFAVYSTKGILIGYLLKEDENISETIEFIDDYLLYSDKSFENMNTRISNH